MDGNNIKWLTTVPAADGNFRSHLQTAADGEIRELTLYNNYWLDKGDYEDKLSDDLSDREGYKDLSDSEFNKMIKQMVAGTEFVKAIVIHVG